MQCQDQARDVGILLMGSGSMKCDVVIKTMPGRGSSFSWIIK